MACCAIPESVRFCKNCGEPLSVEASDAALRFMTSDGSPTSECPGCGYWLSEATTSAEKPVLSPESATD